MHEFKKSTLEEVLSVLESGSRPSGGVDTESGTIPSLGGENIRQDGHMCYNVIKQVHDSFYRNMPRGLLLPYDVLINKDGAQTGKVAIYKGDFSHAAINEHLFLMRGKRDVIEQRFLCYYLLYEATQQQIIKMITGSAQPGINSGFTKHIILDIPSIEQQRRIAEILDTIDDAVQETEALISKLKAMKQGLLHDLLTRGLDENGKLRDPKAHPEQFKDSTLGRIPKSWDISRGMNISELITKGESPNWQGFGYENEGVLFITSENVRDGFLYVSYPKFISPKFDHKLKRSRLKPGDVLINLVGASIGRSCLFLERFGPANINQAVCLFRLRNGVKPDWIVNYLQLPRVISRLLGEQVETARPNLSLTQISDFLFPIPPLYEQTDVAIILSAHDARIRTEEQYRDKLKLQKNGLMHDLLTGKVRVKV